MRGGSKYAVLGKRLADSGLERVTLTFDEMDRLCDLPATAYQERPFWANTWGSPHAREWLQKGYVVEEIDLGRQVTFLRAPIRARDPGLGRRRRAPAAARRSLPGVQIPRPCPAEVEKYLRAWEELENYPAQEAALNDLFFRHCPANKTLSDILLKVAALNTFYSTNIYSITPVAQHILELDIDPRLAAGDLTLVDDLQRVKLGGREKRFYSFASKYCSHHRPDWYPVYDSYVDKMLCYFRDRDGFFGFRDNELKKYPFFRSTITRFQVSYGLEEYSVKDVDKYLWQLGKTYFPNQYGKNERETV